MNSDEAISVHEALANFSRSIERFRTEFHQRQTDLLERITQSADRIIAVMDSYTELNYKRIEELKKQRSEEGL